PAGTGRRQHLAVRADAVPLRPDRPVEATDAAAPEPDRAPADGSRAAVGPRARRHLQSVQGGAVQLEPDAAPRGRTDRRIRLSVALEPAAAGGDAPALGWRQRLGR